MNPLSVTRSARQLTHLLQTPDTFVRTPMPGISKGTAIVHASPELGADFLQYTVELQPGGVLSPAPQQRFFYVLEGTGKLTIYQDPVTNTVFAKHALRSGSFAHLPHRDEPMLEAETAMRIAVIEKKYVDKPATCNWTDDRLAVLVGHEEDIQPSALSGDTGVQVRSLLPADVLYDFAVNTMTYAPGAALSQVEIHYMEHGLLMLQGAGPYKLGDTFYDVRAGDFIWMAPYCPQWFEASADGPAKYLIYKNFNRMPAL